MKKIAIIAALTLAIGASMTAGTMARYTQNIGDVKANITAKKFNAEIISKEEIKLNAAPGEIASQKILVDTSNIETDTRLDFRSYGINKEFFTALKNAGGTLRLEANGNNVPLEYHTYEEGGDIFFGHYEVDSTVNQVEYEFFLDWSNGMSKDVIDNDELTAKLQGNGINFNVNIHATQK